MLPLAAEQLRQFELLKACIDDWQGLESHSSFVGSLRNETPALTRNFWALLER